MWVAHDETTPASHEGVCGVVCQNWSDPDVPSNGVGAVADTGIVAGGATDEPEDTHANSDWCAFMPGQTLRGALPQYFASSRIAWVMPSTWGRIAYSKSGA